MMDLRRWAALVMSGALGWLWCLPTLGQEPLPPRPDPGAPGPSASAGGARPSCRTRSANSRRWSTSSRRGSRSSRRGLRRRLSPRRRRSSSAESGLAGPGGFKEERGPGDSGLRVPSADGSGRNYVGSGGTRELPNSQLDGNRHLGKIPLKTYFDYDLDGVGFATEDDEFQLRFRILGQVDYNGYLGPAGLRAPTPPPAASTSRDPVTTFRAGSPSPSPTTSRSSGATPPSTSSTPS